MRTVCMLVEIMTKMVGANLVNGCFLSVILFYVQTLFHV